MAKYSNDASATACGTRGWWKRKKYINKLGKITEPTVSECICIGTASLFMLHRTLAPTRWLMGLVEMVLVLCEPDLSRYLTTPNQRKQLLGPILLLGLVYHRGRGYVLNTRQRGLRKGMGGISFRGR